MASEKDAAPKIEVLKSEGDEEDKTIVTFIINKEDHTMGNVLKHIISKYSEVEFCSYNIPHPTEDRILFRIQTKAGHSAKEMLARGLRDSKIIFAEIRTKFQKAMHEYEESQQNEAMQVA